LLQLTGNDILLLKNLGALHCSIVLNQFYLCWFPF